MKPQSPDEVRQRSRAPMRVSAERAAEIRESDSAALVKRRDSKAATGRAPAVPAKAKAAIAVLLEQPKTDIEAAANAVGLTTHMLKRYLKLPHVRAYFVAERQAVLDAICAGNPVALKAIRDDSSNKMASVAAVRGLEQMRNETEENSRQRGGQALPGFTIVINQGSAPPQTIDQMLPVYAARPVIEGTAEEAGE